MCLISHQPTARDNSALRLHGSRCGPAWLAWRRPCSGTHRVGTHVDGVHLVVQVTEAGNCLRVEVLRGTHMPRMDWTGGADPYVVLAAQSEAGLQMFRCPSAWDTLVRPPSHDPRVPSEPRFLLLLRRNRVFVAITTEPRF